uniref:RNase H type-1 domain-containing protein n=1 Tax=Chenopodium quinoa TaxID=63459 RepID=A0A803L7L3_CHEQI
MHMVTVVVAVVDGRWLEEGVARTVGEPAVSRGGGLIRDTTSRLCNAYSLKLGSCVAFKAEVLEIEYGLELAKRMGIKKLQIQLDNQAVVQILNSTDGYNGECIHDIEHCRKLIARQEWTVEVKHVYREANQAAD